MANKREACVDSNKKLSSKQARKFRLSMVLDPNYVHPRKIRKGGSNG